MADEERKATVDKVAFFGKGGIGKSTIAANLSALAALDGLRVLHVGCDPKHDSTVALVERRDMVTFMDKLVTKFGSGQRAKWTVEDLISHGRLGVDCVEAGGPEPGVGCAGRGISLMLDTFAETKLLEEQDYDLVLYDVLGDVVCGGFAAPLRKGYAEKVVIVISEELMALYAANNIAKAVRTYASNGIFLAGLVANVRDSWSGPERLDQFAQALNTRILQVIPRDPVVREAEFAGQCTAVEHAPDAVFTQRMQGLQKELFRLGRDDCPAPTPLSDDDFYGLWRSGDSTGS